MAGRVESLLLRAQDQGCNNCGARGDVFYAVQFYFLPSRLIRKRHRDRQHSAIYCRECYESHPTLPLQIDDTPSSVPTSPAAPSADRKCHLCETTVRDNHMNGKLYGSITTTFWVGVNMTECRLLAFVCGDCVESHKISLMAKI